MSVFRRDTYRLTASERAVCLYWRALVVSQLTIAQQLILNRAALFDTLEHDLVLHQLKVVPRESLVSRGPPTDQTISFLVFRGTNVTDDDRAVVGALEGDVTNLKADNAGEFPRRQTFFVDEVAANLDCFLLWSDTVSQDRFLVKLSLF